MWKTEIDAGETVRNYERATKRLDSATDIHTSDKEDIKRFVNHLLADGVGKERVIKYINHLTVLSRMSAKPLSQHGRVDVETLVGRINTKDYTGHTKHDYKIVIKRYIQWLKGCEDGEYPPEVKWIKTAFSKKRLLPEALLTADELRKLVDATENPRDRALLLTDYESGCRIGEILNLRIRNVNLDQYGAILIVDGKTGPRRVRVIVAGSALTQWLSIHPFRNDKNSPLWVGVGTAGRYEPLKYHGARAMFRRLAEKTGIGKRVYSHLLRHTRATELANILTDAQMKEHLGWVQGSDMPAVYVHLSGRNVDAPLLRANGISIDENEAPIMMLSSEVCPRCKQRTLSSAQFCLNCGTNLVMKRSCVIFPPRRRNDYNRFKYGVEGDYENEYYIEPE
jgi:integrase/recombinase XerD